MINFLKFKWLYFAISSIVILSGIFSIGIWGYRYSVDFAGGTTIEYRLSKTINTSRLIRNLSTQKISITDARQNGNVLRIRSDALDQQKEGIVKKLILQEDPKANLSQLTTVGPTIGKELFNKTIIAAIVAIVGILIYVSIAFKGLNFAFAAVLAMAHDFLVVIGSYSLMSHFLRAEVDALFITALLTTMSFSVHDTIIIFDKIREYRKTEKKGNVESYANRALTETIIRSINNSMTIIFVLLALSLLGGSTIRFFVITLLIGTITGTYSSPFVATPIWVFLEQKANRK